MRATVFYDANVGMTSDHLPRYGERQTTTEVSVDADGDLVIELPGVVRQEIEESGLRRFVLRLPRPVLALAARRGGIYGNE